MNDSVSKKIIIIRIAVVVIALIIIALSIFLIVKCNVFDFILNEKRYVRDVGFIPPSSESTIKKVYIDEPKKEIKKEVVVKKKVEEKKVDKTPWWHSFKSFISDIENSVTEFFSGIKVKDDAAIKKNERSKDAIKIQNRFYEMHLENNKWHIISLDNNGYGYNYFFNDKGKLLVDTVTKDYKIVDKSGRELDRDLVPIKYKVATVSNIIIDKIEETKEPAKVLYSPGAIVKAKSKLYDNMMDRNMLNYIEYSNGFKKTTNGTIYNGSKWRGVSSLKDDGSKVIFYNPNNNFNKITGTITHQEVTNSDNNTRCTLYVYDKEHDNVNTDDYLYMCDSFNYNEPIRFSFTFYRSVKSMEFFIETDGDSKKRICYLKNLRFGFDKNAYKDELEEKQNEEDYINLLKELGIYHEIYEIEEDEVSDDEYDYYIDDYEFIDYDDIDLIDRDYRSKEDKARDRVTGPAFDPELKKLKQIWEEGPAFYK